MKAPLQVNVCSENWVLLSSDVIGICTYVLSKSACHSDSIKYLVLSLGSGLAWTYWCWFQKGSKHCFRIHFISSCCWRYLGEKNHTLHFRTGWRKSVSIPKSSNKRCEWMIIIIWIFASVSENPSEIFVLYARQCYNPSVLPYAKTKDFSFPFMSYNNHLFPSVKYMQNVE